MYDFNLKRNTSFNKTQILGITKFLMQFLKTGNIMSIIQYVNKKSFIFKEIRCKLENFLSFIPLKEYTIIKDLSFNFQF